MRNSNIESMNNMLLKPTTISKPRNYCKWGLLIVSHSLTVLLGFYIGKHIYSTESDGSL
jgi:hypothetical protein